MKTKIVIILAVLALLIGCSEPMSRSTGPVEKPVYIGTYVRRIVDEEAGVVCWIHKDTYQGGISCLPLSETKLAP
jgi:uncharacterized protein YceK